MPRELYQQSFESQVSLTQAEIRATITKVNSYLIGEGLIAWGKPGRIEWFYHSENASVAITSRHIGNHSVGMLVASDSEHFLEELANALPELKPQKDRIKIEAPKVMTSA